ncbi:fluoride efflux transporter CrcB [Streptomyces sp. NPDC020800]|uniref:fluoride efflux transporter CrcB n=1 Tax=Streptomyces sp. NPDC020800 TaxID=3365092 RepID=UPI0037B08531
MSEQRAQHSATTAAVDISAAEEAKQRRDARHRQLWVLTVVAAGGATGACARYAAALLWPTGKADFPWTTLGVNAVGCLIIGVFLVAITEGWTAHPLLRPFFATGVLGGFTTFSTYCVDIERLVREDRAGVALAYLAATVVFAMVAVKIGVVIARRAVLAMRGSR